MNSEKLKLLLDQNIAPQRQQWRRRNWYYYKDIERFVRYAVPPGARVLEIGFDNGWLLHSTKPAQGTYFGLSSVLNAEGRTLYPELTFTDIDSFTHLPASQPYDYIIIPNVIGLVEDVQSLLEALRPLSHPRTRIIITYYNFLWEPIIKLAETVGLKQPLPIQNWFSPQDISVFLDLVGFEVIRSNYRLPWPKYFPLIANCYNQIVSKLPLFNRLGFWHYTIARPKPTTTNINDQYSVSVVIPARNEKGNIARAVEQLPKLGKSTEIIFIEGGSSDDTWSEIQRVAEHNTTTHTIITAQQTAAGKGAAVRQGFAMASGDLLMILDADLTVAPEELPRFYNALASGQAEYAHGTRLIYPMEKEAMRFLNLLGNKFFSAMFSWLLHQRIKDTLCGTKVLFKSDYELLAANRNYFGDFDPFGDFDLIFGANKLGLKMVEIPVHYKERTYGTTNISRFRHGWILLKMCWFASRKLE